MIRKYRKRPVVIEAIRFTDENVGAIAAWSIEHATVVDGVRVLSITMPNGSSLSIRTKEGTMTAQLGDYIIRGVAGEFYPCKPDIFAATYDEVIA